VLDSLFDRLSPAPGPANARCLQTLRSLVLLHAAVRTWAWASSMLAATSGLEAATTLAFALTMSAAAAATLIPRFGRWAAAVAAGLLTAELVSSFPGTPNHVYLEYLCVLLFASLTEDDEVEGPLLLATLRWMTVVVLFYTGLQKLLGGYFVNGEFLVWAVSARDRFGDVFALLLPGGELERIRALDGLTVGSGPYRTHYLPFLIASNAVWVAELVLPVLLVVRNTRVLAAVASIALILAIQVGAREVMFALLFSQLLLLFVDGGISRRTAVVFVAAYLYVLGFLAGVAPGDFLVRGKGGL